MATQGEIQQVAVPTEVPSDLKVDLISIDGKNLTMPGKNGTIAHEDDFNFEEWMDDLIHFRNLPSAKSIFVWIVTVVHYVFDFFLDYLLTDVCMTLAMVEAPEVVVPAPWTDKKDDTNEDAPRIQLKHERSITTSLRRTVAHLYRVGGPLALCRGIAVHVCSGVSIMFMGVMGFLLYHNPLDHDLDFRLEHPLAHKLGQFTFETVATFVTGVLFAPMITAWVHIVISQPSLRIWWRRLPPYLPSMRAILLPMLYASVTDNFVHTLVPVLLKHALGMGGKPPAVDSSFSSRNILLTLVWLAVCVLDQIACVPLHFAITRIQASLLPEEEETIVSFDRSFGTSGSNGLRPGLLAESRGALSFREAWRSVTWSEMRRIWIFSAKILAVQICVNGMFWLVGGKNAWPSSWDPRMI